MTVRTKRQQCLYDFGLVSGLLWYFIVRPIMLPVVGFLIIAHFVVKFW